MYRYFTQSETSRVTFLYRWPANGKSLPQQDLRDVERFQQDGGWARGFREALLRQLCQGWFDEAEDEITEEQAINVMAMLKARTNGS